MHAISSIYNLHTKLPDLARNGHASINLLQKRPRRLVSLRNTSYVLLRENWRDAVYLRQGGEREYHYWGEMFL